MVKWPITFYPGDCGTPKKECYGELGCFFTDKGPLKQFCRLPYHPKDMDTEFRLFLKSKPGKEHRLHYNDKKSLDVLPRYSKLAIVFHGNYESSYDKGYTLMKDELLGYTEYNAVLFVDFSMSTGLTGQQDIMQSYMNVGMAGREATFLTKQLMDSRDLHPSSVYHICFSLGCAAPRMAADWAKQRYGFRIGRISVIEHTAVFLEFNRDSMVLPEDADFVDAIHTGSGYSNPILMLAGRLAVSIPLGHVDFYVNSARDQPHCLLEPHFICSHITGRRMFTYSIRTCKYETIETCSAFDVFEKNSENQCKNANRDARTFSRLGFHSAKFPQRGVQHVKTANMIKPYC